MSTWWQNIFIKKVTEFPFVQPHFVLKQSHEYLNLPAYNDSPLLSVSSKNRPRFFPFCHIRCCALTSPFGVLDRTCRHFHRPINPINNDGGWRSRNTAARSRRDPRQKMIKASGSQRETGEGRASALPWQRPPGISETGAIWSDGLWSLQHLHLS